MSTTLNWERLYNWRRPELRWKQNLPTIDWSFDESIAKFKYRYNNTIYTVGTGTDASSIMATHEATYNHNLIATALQVETDPIFNAWLIATPPLYTETDPVYTASTWFTTTNNASDWDTAYSWGDHALANYQTHYTILDTLGILANGIGQLTNDGAGNLSWAATSGMVYPGAGIALSTGAAWGASIANNSANWNTAYGWGESCFGRVFDIGCTNIYLYRLWLRCKCINGVKRYYMG